MSEASHLETSVAPYEGARRPDAVDLGPGEHLCAFYRGSEGLAALLVPFLAQSLRNDEACVGIIDGAPRNWVLSRFDREGAVVRGRLRRRFRLAGSEESCRRNGSFSAERLLTWLDGGPAVRVAAEMTSELRGVHGHGALAGYEEQLAEATASGLAILCLYDLGALDGGTVVEVIRTHRKVLVEGSLVENPFC